MIVALIVPIVVTVREVHRIHVGAVVRVLSGGTLPMSVARIVGRFDGDLLIGRAISHPPNLPPFGFYFGINAFWQIYRHHPS